MPRADSIPQSRWVVLGRDGRDATAAHLASDASEIRRERVLAGDLPAWVRATERQDVRWVWADAPLWYPALLRAGVTVARCHDVRLCHAIVRNAASVTDADALRSAIEWDAAASAPTEEDAATPTLFDLDGADAGTSAGVPSHLDDVLAEFRRQLDAVSASTDPDRLRLLLAAESAGALIACEIHAAGVPWDAATHRRLLTDQLGKEPLRGSQPAQLAAVAEEVRAALGDPTASLDSHPRLLRSLHRAGLMVTSTSRWELGEHRHPVIAPLLEYKRLVRLYTANGWAWLDAWVADGRYRPVFTPGGVVTGRWASTGGGALQVPRQLRPAVRADTGWLLIVADVAQLEPRVLAAMSADTALADAARGRDLYDGIVDTGAVSTRSEAKLALLGAMYGATTGDGGRLVPRLRHTFPRAMALVDDAARTGETGGVVSTLLGRTSPPPSDAWRELQAGAGKPDATAADETAARRRARDRGRFTRNFVVQGTAAEWALAWIADLRGRLAAFDEVPLADAAPPSGPVFSRRAHVAFFLHDEIVVHAPIAHAEAAADAVREAAASATRLLFGGFPLDFRLDLRISESAAKP